MPELSRLIHVMSHGNQNLPAETGILEIQKLRGTLVQAMFTSYDGRMWRGGMYSGTWTGWGGTDGVPTGSLSYYAGPVAPVGWIFCQGQAVSRVIYGVLFRSLVLPVEMETEAPHSICRIAAVVLFVVLMTARELIQEDFLVLFNNRGCRTLKVRRDHTLLKQEPFRADTKAHLGLETEQMAYGVVGKTMDMLSRSLLMLPNLIPFTARLMKYGPQILPFQ